MQYKTIIIFIKNTFYIIFMNYHRNIISIILIHTSRYEISNILFARYETVFKKNHTNLHTLD